MARHPEDARLRFALAVELEREGRWEDVVAHLQAYLARAEDEGNGWGRLARALWRLGRVEEARSAWRRGIEAARRHGHPSLAAELEDELAAAEDDADGPAV